MKQIVATQDLNPKKDDWFRVEWNIGKRCNFDCSYCGSSVHDNFSPHMPYEKITESIDTIRSSTDKKIKIGWTGGEPFVHPKFIDIIKYAKEQANVFRQTVVTNGTVPFKTYEKALPYLDQVSFSYHFEHTIHDKIINNIENVFKYYSDKDCADEVKVHMMMLPGTFDKAEEIIKYLRSKHIEVIARRIRPQSNVNGDLVKPWESGMTATGLWDGKYYSNEELQWLEAGV